MCFILIIVTAINEFGLKHCYVTELFFDMITGAGKEVQCGSVSAEEANAVHPTSC